MFPRVQDTVADGPIITIHTSGLVVTASFSTIALVLRHYRLAVTVTIVLITDTATQIKKLVGRTHELYVPPHNRRFDEVAYKNTQSRIQHPVSANSFTSSLQLLQMIP